MRVDTALAKRTQAIRVGILRTIGSIVALGALVFVASIALRPFLPGADRWLDLAQDIAIVLAITALITGVFEYFGLGELAEQVEGATNELGRVVGVLLGANEARIANIYPTRDKAVVAMQHAIREAIHQANGEVEVLVAGVGLPDFFASRRVLYPDIEALLGSGRARLRVILLDPTCEAAEERDELEDDFDTRWEIGNSIHVIQGFIDRGLPIQWRTYTGRPIAFMLCTPSCLFTEQYHCGKATPDQHGDIGGEVPSVQYSFDSRTYRALKSHFEHLWAASGPPRAAPPTQLGQPVQAGQTGQAGQGPKPAHS